MKTVIKNSTATLPFLAGEEFEPAKHGSKHLVFLSENFCLRARRQDEEVLHRESDFLQSISHPLIPNVRWEGEIDNKQVMVEDRLSGEMLSLLWHDLPIENQKRLVREVVSFMLNLRQTKRPGVYSVKSGKNYPHFYDYLLDRVAETKEIDDWPEAKKVRAELSAIVLDESARHYFDEAEITLVHGDLLIHNLLSDGKNLTGVVDWETGLWGDPDFDVCRLIYYRELARSYFEKNRDEVFECDYMNKLFTEINSSGLIKNEELLKKKYSIIRAVFYLQALDWAVNSSNPEANIKEIITRINTNRLEEDKSFC